MTARLAAPRPLPLVLLALVAALLLTTLAPLAGVAPRNAVLAAATDLTLVTDTTYTVHPSRNRVHVTMDVTARNNTRETKARRFFFTHAFLAVQPGATNVEIKGAKGAKAKVQKRSKDSTLLRIDFGSRLYSGKARDLTVSFDLVDKGEPADRQLRVGPSLVTLPVWAHASNGAKGGTVTVRVPKGYDVTVENGTFDRTVTTADGDTELRATSLAKPLDFFAFVSAQKPAEYAETPLAVPAGDETIDLTLRGWKDDPAWSTRIGDLFTRSLPVLRDEVGLPWPHEQPLTVEEAASRTADGYAGLFDPAANRVEVAYWADRLVVVHEAAHGWFNGSLLADRWANEGFAALYAGRAAEAIDAGGTQPELTDALREHAIPLNSWAVTPAPTDNESESENEGAGAGPGATDARTEAYGYAASLALATAIAERAGDDTLRAVWADAAAGAGAYQPDAGLGTGATTDTAELETGSDAVDWRTLLDLLEARTGQDFTDLWREWVVEPDQAALLDARATARASYARTLALAGDWALPRSIRDALRAWDFDTANRLMADARTVLAQRGAIETMAANDGIELPDDMQTLFEAGQLVDASARAEAERNAMVTIAGAEAARSTETDPLTTIGMVGENPSANIAKAREALAAGDLPATLDAADDAYRAWGGAWQEGRRRVLLLIAVLATILVLGSAVVNRVRHARSAAPATGVTPANTSLALPTGRRATQDAEPTPEELLAASTPPIPDTAGGGTSSSKPPPSAPTPTGGSWPTT
ncbi:MAG TPA: hypothetical protein VFL03_16415 [Candidatus Limnocylindrales bacterium]|nr:hypothetical protein [Candidatus Limnocylindrales bacterium]